MGLEKINLKMGRNDEEDILRAIHCIDTQMTEDWVCLRTITDFIGHDS